MSFYTRCLRPFLFHVPAETAHHCAIRALRAGVVPGREIAGYSSLRMLLWGKAFCHPVGLAAGFDKDAAVIPALFRQGFSFVEVGTVTPRPQEGNPQPRLFRLEEDQAIINRMGFNNAGLDQFVANLKQAMPFAGAVGANIGKNKDSPDALADYRQGLQAVYPYSDYITVNISSPNTPGLRNLQQEDALDGLLAGLIQLRNGLAESHGMTVPMLVKVAPDMDDAGLESVASVAMKHELDGLIVSNTTVSRPGGLVSANREETGGLSGAPLFEMSTERLRRCYQLTEGKIPLIGVGGIASAEDAYAKIRAGASLVQLYSALIYEGFGLVRTICDGLAHLLERDGYSRLSEAVGADA